MAIDPNAFSFDTNPLNLDPTSDLIAHLPSGLTDRDSLFDVLASAMAFPYFGRNWDALFDLLQDFSWLPNRRIILIHNDVPALGAESLRLYLDVLSDSVQGWKPGEDHELIVVFPTNAREIIRGVMK